MINSSLVFPGDKVAVEEEYFNEEGTFTQDGMIYASQIGILELNDNDCIARVISPNPPNILKDGDIVYAVISDIRNTMATADVIAKDNVDRELGGDTYATIHVSKILQGYTSDIYKEIRRGDYIRAKVIGVKPSLQLTTKYDHLGVIRSLCDRCRSELIRRGNGLYCQKCKCSTTRKLADDYGDVNI